MGRTMGVLKGFFLLKKNLLGPPLSYPIVLPDGKTTVTITIYLEPWKFSSTERTSGLRVDTVLCRFTRFSQRLGASRRGRPGQPLLLLAPKRQQKERPARSPPPAGAEAPEGESPVRKD